MTLQKDVLSGGISKHMITKEGISKFESTKFEIPSCYLGNEGLKWRQAYDY